MSPSQLLRYTRRPFSASCVFVEQTGFKVFSTAVAKMNRVRHVSSSLPSCATKTMCFFWFFDCCGQNLSSALVRLYVVSTIQCRAGRAHAVFQQVSDRSADVHEFRGTGLPRRSASGFSRSGKKKEKIPQTPPADMEDSFCFAVPWTMCHRMGIFAMAYFLDRIGCATGQRYPRRRTGFTSRALDRV